MHVVVILTINYFHVFVYINLTSVYDCIFVGHENGYVYNLSVHDLQINRFFTCMNLSCLLSGLHIRFNISMINHFNLTALLTGQRQKVKTQIRGLL